jgi:hypothetical protein
MVRPGVVETRRLVLYGRDDQETPAPPSKK